MPPVSKFNAFPKILTDQRPVEVKVCRLPALTGRAAALPAMRRVDAYTTGAMQAPPRDYPAATPNREAVNGIAA